MAHSDLNRHHPGWTITQKWGCWIWRNPWVSTKLLLMKVGRIVFLSSTESTREAGSENSGARSYYIGGGFSKIFFCLNPDFLGKWSNLTSIFFQMGWFNHQLGSDFFFLWSWWLCFLALFCLVIFLGILWYTQIIWVITWIGSNYMGFFHPCKYIAWNCFCLVISWYLTGFHGNSAMKTYQFGRIGLELVLVASSANASCFFVATK